MESVEMEPLELNMEKESVERESGELNVETGSVAMESVEGVKSWGSRWRSEK